MKTSNQLQKSLLIILMIFNFSIKAKSQVRLNLQNKFHIGYDTYTPIFLGKNIVGSLNNGKWSVEYWENSVSPGIGGLNFWIPWPAAGAQNNVLFLRDVNGNVGIGKNNPSYKLDVNGSVNCTQLFLLSDERLKYDIKKIHSPEAIIMNLNAYRYKKQSFIPNNIDTNQKDEIKYKTTLNEEKLNEKNMYVDEYGYLAQDLKKVIPEIIQEDENGIYSVSYVQLIPIAIELIKTQQERLNGLEETVNKLTEILNNSNQNHSIDSNKNDLNKDFVLYQNEPNPFSDKTEIKGIISKSFSKAFIVVMNLQGTVMRTFQIEKMGEFSVMVNSGDLNSGLYYYSLIVDSKELDTKKMFIQK